MILLLWVRVSCFRTLKVGKEGRKERMKERKEEMREKGCKRGREERRKEGGRRKKGKILSPSQFLLVIMNIVKLTYWKKKKTNLKVVITT